MNQLEQRVIKSHDGVQLTYRRSRGKGRDREAVVFINPPDQGTWWWEDIARRLSGHYDLLLAEPRGFPEAANVLSKDQTSFRSQALDVDALLQAEEISRAHFVGWCAGGKLMLDLYERRPDAVRSMFGVGMSFRSGRSDERQNYYALVSKHPPAVKYLLGLAHTFSRLQKPRELSHEIAGLPSEALNATIDVVGQINFIDKYSDAGQFQSRLLQYYLTESGLLNVLAMVSAYRDVDKTAVVPRVAVPFTVLHGTLDRVIPFSAEDEALLATNPGIRFLPVPGGSHYLHVQNGGLVLDELVSTIEAATTPLRAAKA
jgi:pimeloyl-ACP methyl ester carboxylesterase